MSDSASGADALRGELLQTQTRLAKLEGDFASSWAAQSREEYEQRVRGACRDDVFRFAVKLSVAVVAVIGGGTFAALNWAVQNAYRSETANLIRDFQQQYDRAARASHEQGEWQQLHNAGVQCRYLLEAYAVMNLRDDARRALAEKAIRRAREYFRLALDKRPQGQTYWELGDMYYVHPRNHGLKSLINPELALEYYQDAVKQYTESDIEKGWRAQAYVQMSRMELETSPPPESARKRLELAREDYQGVAREVYDREARLDEIRTLLHQLKGSRPEPNKTGAVTGQEPKRTR